MPSSQTLQYRKEIRSAIGWSDLPTELLVTIAEKLIDLTDQIRFCSVCVSWRSTFRSLLFPPQHPWLILPSGSVFRFYSFSEDRIYPKIPLPDDGISYLYGSGNGWVFAIKEQYRQLIFSIINPFIGSSISLPSPDPNCSLSFADNSTLIWARSDSVVVAACSFCKGVYYCRKGDNSWSKVMSLQNKIPSSIVFFSDKFYINLFHSSCKAIVLDKDTLKEISLIDLPRVLCPFQERLFMSSRELMFIVKTKINHANKPRFYKVFRAGINENVVTWNEVNDIGDRALFVDSFRCISVEVSEESKLRRNCIYSAYLKRVSEYTRIYSINMSLTKLGNIEGEQLYRKVLLENVVSAPTWILPSLNSVEM